jgi:hypothetical protein
VCDNMYDDELICMCDMYDDDFRNVL